MSHHYSNKMVVRCADDRYSPGREFAGPFEQFLIDHGAKDCFLQVDFGGSLGITKEFNYEAWLDRVESAKALGINEVIFVDHMACGKFTLEFGELTADEEHARHTTCLHAAQRFFQEHAPEFKVSTYLQTGDNWDRFDQIV